jgi:hypothetical protein
LVAASLLPATFLSSLDPSFSVEKGQFRDRDSLIVSEQELNDQSTKLD